MLTFGARCCLWSSEHSDFELRLPAGETSGWGGFGAAVAAAGTGGCGTCSPATLAATLARGITTSEKSIITLCY